MPLVPMFSAGALTPLVRYVTARDLPPRLVFGTLCDVLEAHALIPVALGGLAFERAAQALGSDVGLRAVEDVRPEQAGPLARFLLASSQTLGSAVDGLVRSCSRFNTGQRFWVDFHGDEVWLHRRHARALARGRSQANEYALMCVLALLRRAAGRDWRPRQIWFEGDPPAHAERLAALAEHGVSFGHAQTTVVFPRRLLAAPLPHAFDGAGASASDEALPPQDPIASLRQAIAALMQIGTVDVHDAAAAAGQSVRSLQRRLRARGSSFEHLLQQERFRAARRLLADRDAKVIDVAVSLGYSDSANFTRAFRRWAGLSPQAFRRATLELAV